MTGVSLDARAAIFDLNARFAWALDRHEFDALREVFTADVHYVGASGDFYTVEEIIDSFRGRSTQRTTRHGLGNLLLEGRDERTVTGLASWHTFASNEATPMGVKLFLVADFHDVYVQQDDCGWRIQARIITPVFRDSSLAPGAAPIDGGRS